jgi:hypothetical protein
MWDDINALRGNDSTPRSGDVFWHIPTDRAFELTNNVANGSNANFSEYNRVTASGNIKFIGSPSNQPQIVINDGSTDRVIIGYLP